MSTGRLLRQEAEDTDDAVDEAAGFVAELADESVEDLLVDVELLEELDDPPVLDDDDPDDEPWPCLLSLR